MTTKIKLRATRDGWLKQISDDGKVRVWIGPFGSCEAAYYGNAQIWMIEYLGQGKNDGNRL